MIESWIRPLGPLFERYHGRYLLPAAAILLVAARYAVVRARARGRPDRPGSRQADRAMTGALAALAFAAVVVWANFFHFHYGGFANAYEMFHYYLGSKYADEVGYFDLYPAALVADAETGLRYRAPDGLITDLETHAYRRVDWVLANAPLYRARFTEARWREFVGDVVFFRERMGPAAWNGVLRDKGYNATPVWSMVVGGGLSNRVPIDGGRGVTLLALLDVLLLGIAVGAIWRVFGQWPALLAVVLLGSHYLLAHVHMKGAFLRTDFAVCLVLAVCLLRVGRHGAAGALAGYAALSRIFPAVFLFGIAAKAAWDALPPGRGKKDDAAARRRRIRFLGAFAGTVVLLACASVLWHGGTGVWTDFAHKIRIHRANPHIWNLGFDTILDATFDVDGVPAERRSQTLTQEGDPLPPPVLSVDRAESRWPVRIAVQIAALVAGFFAARRLEDHDALAFGFVPFFFLVAPTYYYWIVLLLPFLFFATRLDRFAGTAGTIYLFLSGLLGFAFYARWDQYFPTYYWMAVLGLVLALALLGAAWFAGGATGRLRETRSRGI